jgi:hypothetical protein
MYKFFIVSLLFLSSCKNWQTTTIEYDRCLKVEKIHAHFYNHNICEWSCLNMRDTAIVHTETKRIYYRLNKKGEIKNIKLKR